jgi:Ca2+-dependent lipid-binding protein
MTPHDPNGKNDPFLKVKLGNVEISRRATYRSATNDPKFFEAFELRATLPGAAALTVEVWDWDRFTHDDFVGATTVDLEDRLFEPTWHGLGVRIECYWGIALG